MPGDETQDWGPPEFGPPSPPVREVTQRTHAKFQTSAGTLAFDLRDGWAPYAGRYVLPRKFSLEIDSAEFEAIIAIEVEVTDQGAECTQLTMRRRPGGPPLTTSGIRVPVETLVKNGLLVAAYELVPDESGEMKAQRLEDAERANAFLGAFRSETRKPRRGVRITRETLEQVADVYRAAVRERQPPNERIAEVFSISKNTAAKWVSRARAQGILGPALGTRAGETTTRREESDG